MTSYLDYRYALSLTSQFYFCSMPIRLDSYESCLYSCQYCFAAARGGSRAPQGLKVADPDKLANTLSRALVEPHSAIEEFLNHKQVIHFGGMSDPFPPLERELGASLRLMQILADHAYPTVISTKGILPAEDAYMNVLRRGNFVIQVSFSSRDERLAGDLDYGAPSPASRLSMLKELHQAGIKTEARLQPLIPGRETEAEEFVEELASIGVQHISVEHLKLPLEGWAGSTRLARALAVDLGVYFSSVKARRVGREWVLPTSVRLPTVLALRDRVHRLGLSFGAADSDLLPLSDGSYCCSGAGDLLNGGSGFESNYFGAVRRATLNQQIMFNSLETTWAPKRSIAMMVNSNSRLPAVNGSGAGIREYLRVNWNGRPNGCSPDMFYGVEPSGELDEQGLVIYTMSDELQSLLPSPIPEAPALL